jgi:hypothetical protein
MNAVSPEKVLFGLMAVELLLVGLFGALGARYAFFHLGREQNLPAWFASLQLFAVAYAALGVAQQEVGLKGRAARRTRPLVWYVLAAGFAFLSLDEFAALHEGIRRQGRTPVWVLVYGPVAGLVAGYSGYEILKRRPIDPRLPYVFGGACLIMGAGAFGAEWVGLHMRSKVWYGLTLVVEEFGEMLGVSLLLYGLLRYRRALAQRGARTAAGRTPVPSSAGRARQHHSAEDRCPPTA